MQEDLRKNFILLSKIAKEKKYAQEYMGLLARRGDIGSIRIGKRWFTTWQWFEEFFENGQKKKEIQSEARNIVPEKIELEKIPVSEREETKIGLHIQVPAIKIQRPLEQKSSASIPVRIGTVARERPVAADIRIRKPIQITGIKQPRIIKREFPKKLSVQKKNITPFPYKEIEFKKYAGVLSPDMAAGEKAPAYLFPRLAFAAAFAIMILLIAISGYFIFSGGLLEKGKVAGASDERNGGFKDIQSTGDFYLTSAGDKIKESVSVSRIIMESVKEKNNAEIK